MSNNWETYQPIEINRLVYEEFSICRQKWAEIIIPCKSDLDRLKPNLVILEKHIQRLKRIRPDCKDFSRYEEYAAEFYKYRDEVFHLLQASKNNLKEYRGLFSATNNIADTIKNLGQTIETLTKLRKEKWKFLTAQSVEYTTKVLFDLIDLKHSIEIIDSNLLNRIKEIMRVFYRNQFILKELLEPTHEWLTSGEVKRCSKCSLELSLAKKNLQHTIYDERSQDYPHYW